jgi:hypothetical protein
LGQITGAVMVAINLIIRDVEWVKKELDMD